MLLSQHSPRLKNRLLRHEPRALLRRVFIAHDFTVGGTLRTDLETISSHPPEGLAIKWAGDDDDHSPGAAKLPGDLPAQFSLRFSLAGLRHPRRAGKEFEPLRDRARVFCVGSGSLF